MVCVTCVQTERAGGSEANGLRQIKLGPQTDLQSGS